MRATSDLQGRGDVDPTTPLLVTFDADMDPTTLSSQAIQLLQVSVPVATTVLPAARTAELRPVIGLAPRTAYEILVTTSVRALDGRRLSDELRIAFTTRDETATDPPRLLASTPSAGANVPPSATFTLEFDRALSPTSVGPASVFVRAVGGAPVGGSHQLQEQRRVVLSTPAALDPGAHELVVTTLLQSALGVPLPRELVIPFQVVDGFAVVRTEPANGARIGLGLARLRIEFSRPAQLSAADGVRLLLDGRVQPYLNLRRTDRSFELDLMPLREAGTYELVVDGVIDDRRLPLGAPFRSTFVVDATLAGWSAAPDLPLQGLLRVYGLGNDVAFAASPSGKAAMAWCERDRGGPQRNAFVATFDGVAWSQPFLLEDTLNDVSYPVAAVNERGDVLVAWTEFSPNASVRFRRRAGGTWGVTQVVGNMARADTAHVAPQGDVGVLGRNSQQRELIAATVLGGIAQPAYVLATASLGLIDLGAEATTRWRDDDGGRRLVLFRDGYALGFQQATWFEPGLGWTTPQRLDTGLYTTRIHWDHVTATGSAVVVYSATDGRNESLYAQCWRGGSWLAAPQLLGELESREPQFITGRSGDTLMLTVRTDQGRRRAHAALFSMNQGAFAAGEFIDDTDVTTTDLLMLVGSPDGRAEVLFWRHRSTGSYLARGVWDAVAQRFLPHERSVDQTLASYEVAHDRAGNAVLSGAGGARRYTQDHGLELLLGNPFRLSPQIELMHHAARIFVLGLRTERVNNEDFDFLRVTTFR